jgi:hypothetical protein
MKRKEHFKLSYKPDQFNERTRSLTKTEKVQDFCCKKKKTFLAVFFLLLHTHTRRSQVLTTKRMNGRFPFETLEWRIE